MNEATWIILLHQLLFQGLFVIKNLSLKLKLGQPIRGDNPEANAAVLFFVVFILTSLYLAMGQPGAMSLQLLPQGIATGLCLLLLCCNLLFGVAALRDLGESWRVGVIEEQQTTLVESGVYRFSRNPYFVSYLLLFAAYTLLLQNLGLLALSFIGGKLVHSMILKEEAYLSSVHGAAYAQYKTRVPRYLLL